MKDLTRKDSTSAEFVERKNMCEKSVESSEKPTELITYRHTIDNLDAALVHILAERFRCTKCVGELKARLGLPASDPKREEEQILRLRALATKSGLDPVFAEKFLKFIVAEVIQHHEDIAAKAQQNK